MNKTLRIVQEVVASLEKRKLISAKMALNFDFMARRPPSDYLERSYSRPLSFPQRLGFKEIRPHTRYCHVHQYSVLVIRKEGARFVQ